MLHDDIERTGEKHASDRNINEMKNVGNSELES